MIGQPRSGESWPWAWWFAIGSMCADQSAPSKSELINLLGTVGPFQGLIKVVSTLVLYYCTWVSADSPSLFTCHGSVAKVSAPNKADPTVFSSVSCTCDLDPGFWGLFSPEKGSFEANQTSSSMEEDSKGKFVHVFSDRHLGHSFSCERELAVPSVSLSVTRTDVAVLLVSHSHCLPLFSMPLSAEIAGWTK